jgi:hypothetical protein
VFLAKMPFFGYGVFHGSGVERIMGGGIKRQRLPFRGFRGIQGLIVISEE